MKSHTKFCFFKGNNLENSFRTINRVEFFRPMIRNHNRPKFIKVLDLEIWRFDFENILLIIADVYHKLDKK